MKMLKIAGLALVSMLVAGMALAGNAAAGPLWLLCLEGGLSLTKYSDSSCTKPASGGAWGSEALGNRSDTVKLQAFTISLTDIKATGGSSTVICGKPTVGWGLISNTNLLLTKVAKVEKPGGTENECEPVSGGCKAKEVEVVEGIHLPWKSELFETENKTLAKILADGNGEPGWKVRCNTLLGKVTDECESTSKTGPEETEGGNETVGGVLLIRAIFRTRIKGKCSVGGENAAEVKGLIAILLWKGSLGLSING